MLSAFWAFSPFCLILHFPDVQRKNANSQELKGGVFILSDQPLTKIRGWCSLLLPSSPPVLPWGGRTETREEVSLIKREKPLPRFIPNITEARMDENLHHHPPVALAYCFSPPVWNLPAPPCQRNIDYIGKWFHNLVVQQCKCVLKKTKHMPLFFILIYLIPKSTCPVHELRDSFDLPNNSTHLWSLSCINRYEQIKGCQSSHDWFPI